MVLLFGKNYQYKSLQAERDYIESELRKEQAKRDSLDTVLGSVRDSLALTNILLIFQKAETEHAKAEAQKQRRKYEGLKGEFKNLTSEERLAELRKLYPSFK